ncbi:UNVERIFIED_CONTAM: Tetraketide alpha-pyrone reductase 1 [Sesamum calycinum]|uniref:Dihydroflavonol 4-reductase n=1 Tax=Sesamum calycinum TaxID=2727403 RepID=A0AAW2PN53_9LAMI
MVMDDLKAGKVCVTGAAGFVASWLVKRLLLSGYHVVGTVRDPDDEKKVGHLKRLEGARERLELVRAELMVPGSFDAPIMGCHGVFHTASPSSVCLSLIPRVRDDFDPALPLNESSWSSEELCHRLNIWYALSKTLAERAAWKFCEDNNIDLVTLLPSFVIGPSLPPLLCSTASDVLGFLRGETEKFQWHGRMGYVHIDDVALSHILLYENENAKGRYLCSSTVLDNHQLAAILSARYPTLPIPKRFVTLDRPHYELDVSKLKGLGMQFRSIQEMFDDCVESLTEQGHLSLIASSLKPSS